MNLRDPRGLYSEGPSEELIWCEFLDWITTRAHCELARNKPSGPDGYSIPAQQCAQSLEPQLSEAEWQNVFDTELSSEELLDLLGDPSSGKSDQRAILPTFAVAAATAANWVVYYAKTPAGQYYIGITNNFLARQAQHAGRFEIQQVPGLPRLNYAAAKGMEQIMIETVRARHGTEALLNRINSISPNTKPYYDRFKNMAQDVLKSCENFFLTAF